MNHVRLFFQIGIPLTLLVIVVGLYVVLIDQTILTSTVNVINQGSMSITTTKDPQNRNVNNNNDSERKNHDTISFHKQPNNMNLVLYNPIYEQQVYDFVMERRTYYETNNVLNHWRMRGVGYLYYYWNMILLATLPQQQQQEPIIQYGRNVVTIYNIMNYNNNHDRQFPVSPYIEKNGIPYINCSLWTLYVRVNGPEIFAGSAEAVTTTTILDSTGTTTSTCYWEFPFNVSVPGTYIVDVKALYYNATSMMDTPCIIYDGEVNPYNTTNQYYNPNYYHHGFKGFKMYSPAEMCCEICSRLSYDCLYWSTPPFGLEEPFAGNNGCELYFRDNTSEWIPESIFVNNTGMNYNNNHRRVRQRLRQRYLRTLRGSVNDNHGPPNGHRDLYFIGCGWSFWMTLDFPCLNGDLDDRIFIANYTSTFVVTDDDNNNDHRNTAITTVPYDSLPYCTLDMEHDGVHNGRWVRAPWPNDTVCPNKMEQDLDNSQQFVIMKYDPLRPQCYHRDDLSIVGHDCIEMNCWYISEESKWRTSSLHLEKKWYGQYQQYQCRYREYTDEELQICINERKIHTFSGSGHSIWHFLSQYLTQRTQNLVLYDHEKYNDGIEIHLSTLGLLHHQYITMREYCKSMPIVDPNQMEYYWVNGLYISSEREHEARGPTQIIKSRLAQEILGPKHYRMINFFDMTSAFTFDTATQMDGMHIIGPPMKMVMTKLFHYVCSNTSIAQRSI